MKNKKNKSRLSTRLFVTIMGASLAMGFVLTAIQITIDYYMTRVHLRQLGSETVITMHYPAMEAAFQRDANMAKRVLEGLFAKPYVRDASLVLVDGTTLASLTRSPQLPAYHSLSDLFFGSTLHHSVSLRNIEDTVSFRPTTQEKAGELGQLTLTLEAAHHGSRFFTRAIQSLWAGILQATGFGLILYYIIHGLITRPFSQLTRAIKSIDPRQPEKSVLHPPAGHENDEIGTWVDQCNQMLEAVAEYSRQRRLAEANVERLANYDTLTELPNRSLFLKRLEQLHQRLPADSGTALLYFGLDDFGSVNLLHSYRAGDQVLIILAERLRRNLPSGALIARVGGDQFCIAVANFNATQARELGEYLLTLACQPYSVSPQALTLSATIGVAFYPRDAHSPEMLLKHAEQAMLLGKPGGGNQVHFYSEIANHRLRATKQLEKDLLLAVENHELSLMFQPQVNLVTGQIDAVEALVRWDHPQRGPVSPDEFIALAESNRAVIPIGLWVLDQACNALAQWHAAGFTRLGLSVNLSAIQLHSIELQEELQRILSLYALPPSSLTLEITETAVIEDLETSLGILQAIKEMGVRLAMDDFGTGYSSLSYLRRMPVDEVKLDRSFFIDIAFQPNSVKIVEAIIHLSHSLNLQVVAEGTESLAHVELLQKCGCDRAQGYYYSEPRHAEDILGLLRRELHLRHPLQLSALPSHMA